MCSVRKSFYVSHCAIININFLTCKGGRCFEALGSRESENRYFALIKAKIGSKHKCKVIKMRSVEGCR